MSRYKDFDSDSDYKKDWYVKNRDKRIEQERVRRENPDYFVKKMFMRANKNAAKRGLIFDIELVDLVIPVHCPIFPWIELTWKSGEGFVDSNMSLDRIDSGLGYVKGNVQIVSYKANRNKNNSTLEELIALGDWAKNVLNTHY